MTGPEVRARLEAYYTRYYRDTLGLPAWRDHVAVRLDDGAHEGRRLRRLEDMLGGSVRGARLLNIGCGTGGFNVVAEAAGARTWGVDEDPRAVDIARRRLPGHRVLCARAETLPFADESFDLVYCYSVLEHVEDARASLAEAVRVLRRGGRLYLHTPNRWTAFEAHYKVLIVPGCPRALARLYLAARGRPTAFLGTLRLLSFGECRTWLETAGARIVTMGNVGLGHPVVGRIWPLIRLFYRLFRIRPSIEIVALRPPAP